MNSAAPKIGFDRFIHNEWATLALKIRAEQAGNDELPALLETAGLSLEARKKTRTVLNRLWLQPRPDMVDFVDRGVALFQNNPEIHVPMLHWGVAVSIYPFFGKVAEVIGRLTSLHGDCTSTEVQRRMSEVYGEREGTYRMTNMVIQTQADWGAIERVEKGKRIIRTPAVTVSNPAEVVWLLEAAIRQAGRSIQASTIGSVAAIYPFKLDGSLTFLASTSQTLELRSLGSGKQEIALFVQ